MFNTILIKILVNLNKNSLKISEEVKLKVYLVEVH